MKNLRSPKSSDEAVAHHGGSPIRDAAPVQIPLRPTPTEKPNQLGPTQSPHRLTSAQQLHSAASQRQGRASTMSQGQLRDPGLSLEYLVSQLGASAVRPASTDKAAMRRKAGEPALISEDDLERVLGKLKRDSAQPARDKVTVLLTIRAGLIPSEIASLMTRNLLGPTGELLDKIVVEGVTRGKFQARTIPMHWQLRAEMLRFFEEFPGAERIAWRMAANGSVYYQSASAIIQWLRRLYGSLGLQCTSTSGQRTFEDGLYRLGVQPLDVQRGLGFNSLPKGRQRRAPNDSLATIINQLGRSQ